MANNSFTIFVADQLSDISNLHTKAMFGGYGLYAGDTFFGIIHKDELFFKTDETTRKQYIERGSGPFRPNKKQTLKNYYRVPAELLDDPDELTQWAQESIRIAQK